MRVGKRIKGFGILMDLMGFMDEMDSLDTIAGSSLSIRLEGDSGASNGILG